MDHVQVDAFLPSAPLPTSWPEQRTLLWHANNNQKKPIASINSDGVVSRGPRPTGSLGKPSKRKTKKPNNGVKPMSKKERQRTANGTIDSNTSSNNSNVDPSQQAIQVVRGTRGNKTVTIVRGMTATAVDDKKKILKTLKSKLGVGGTLVDGVLEVQGPHMDKVVELLQGMGYDKARKVGK
ncbi:Translation initiation factor SUI1 [Seminavis robusta]|uniref:Translation initiation factor SUI1 n=1 Tax=Seminavis robusta TaxID=568900 RepID=A0A9N8ERJ8_9STRA|nr:Translation initiation factor SUI1 [Seminavis robusta]|eukprot:Sro1583_g283930.1 Translation initiation factor SUI1 (181) ;mRNA; f:8518-9060